MNCVTAFRHLSGTVQCRLTRNTDQDGSDAVANVSLSINCQKTFVVHPITAMGDTRRALSIQETSGIHRKRSHRFTPIPRRRGMPRVDAFGQKVKSTSTDDGRLSSVIAHSIFVHQSNKRRRWINMRVAWQTRPRGS
jgi:hypothetical protein